MYSRKRTSATRRAYLAGKRAGMRIARYKKKKFTSYKSRRRY